MGRYLKYFPKPFLEDLVAGRCIPMIGAGFSRNARMPKDVSMKDWEGLGRHIASFLPDDYEYKGAIEAISAYAYEYSRVKLIEELSNILVADGVEPGETHSEFCQMPFEIVCTTNLEFLLERGYEREKSHCRPVIDEEQLSIAANPKVVTLVKLHGDLHHPSRMVVTEEDYDGFLDRYPVLATYLANLLITRTALFIGYSLDDPDFRQVWQLVGDRLGKLRRYAYTLAIDAPAHVIARFERRGVKVINLPGNPKDYGRILRETLAELREYWTSALLKASTSTSEESQVELSMPKDAKSRLCFFSIPLEAVAFYRSHVYPIAEKFGFAPVTTEDIVSPGDPVIAKTMALTDRAELFVMESGSNSSLHETQAILARNPKMLLIIPEEQRFPLMSNLLLVRPRNNIAAQDAFLAEVEAWFKDVSNELRRSYAEEPRRLLQKEEWRAAIVSAYTVLENEIRAVFEPLNPDAPFHGQSFRRHLQQLTTYIQGNEDLVQRVIQGYSTRNELVHTSREVPSDLASSLVDDVYALLDKIPKTPVQVD